MNEYERLVDYFKNRDRVVYSSLLALKHMKGDKLLPYAEDILGFLDHKGLKDPFELYLLRIEKLRRLQDEFERTGRYSIRRHADVEEIDREEYNLSLLLSFITTHHRFEILLSLVDFLKLEHQCPRKLLSIGVGTGYEIKLAYDCLNDWEILAFDSSKESIEYASDLLSFFDLPCNSLILGEFRMESDKFLGEYEERFGKIIVCEVMEHIENPEKALSNLKKVLHSEGRMFITMAINIAQEDHIYLYSSVQQAKEQILNAGLKIVSELATPVMIFPFKEKDRERVFKKGNYIAVVEKGL